MIKKVQNSFLSVTIGFFILLLISSCQKPSATDVERNVKTDNRDVTQSAPETHVDCRTIQQPISIANPLEGSHVCMRTMVVGCITDTNLQVFVLIHPMATDKFWVQPIPNVHTDGKWETYCYFGNPKEGIGEPFEIIVVASRNRNLFREGDTLPSPLMGNSQIPTRSNPVTVIRAECLQ